MANETRHHLYSIFCGILLGSWAHYIFVSRRHTRQLERIENALKRLNAFIEKNAASSAIGEGCDVDIGRRIDNVNSARIRSLPHSPTRVHSPFDEPFYDTQDSFINETSDLNFEKLDEQLDVPETNFTDLCGQLNALIPQYSKDAEFWWRLAKATYMHAKSDQFANDTPSRIEKFRESHQHAERALGLDGDNANAHKWAAITIGSLADYVGMRERITNGLAFHRHLEAAMIRKKDDPTLYHLAGRFIIQIVALTWIEHKLVSTFVDELPDVSNRQAVDYFLQAHQLKPKWKENHLYLAKTLLADKRKEEARKILEESLEMAPNSTVEEQQVHTKIIELHRSL